MASLGFSYAQIHVRREQCKLKVEETERKTKEAMGAGGGQEEGVKRPMAEDYEAGGGSLARGRVHPCAGTAAAAPPNGDR
uniref:Uncharacterized protein n=1 Tax=Arundo donax TaxID=35708 RepID=A0A0A8ZKM3_ARUDO